MMRAPGSRARIFQIAPIPARFGQIQIHQRHIGRLARGTFETASSAVAAAPTSCMSGCRRTSSASPSRISGIVVHGENTNRMSPPISRLPGPSRFQSMWTIPRRTATATASVRSCQSKFQQNAIFISMLQHLMLARTEPLAVTLRRCPILRKALGSSATPPNEVLAKCHLTLSNSQSR